MLFTTRALFCCFVMGSVQSIQAQPLPILSEVAIVTKEDSDINGFGTSVALDGETLAVGASQPMGNLDRASVYVFFRDPDSGAWIQQVRLFSDEARDAKGIGFGEDIALEGDTLVAGCAQARTSCEVPAFPAERPAGEPHREGAGEVFVRMDGAWLREAELTALGSLDKQLGRSVALSGDRVALGAPLEDEAGQNAGAVYFFVRNQGLWSQEVKLLPEDGENAPSFGVSVALQGSLAAVGAPASEEGSTYTYELVGNTWSATGQLFAPDGHIDDRFGGALRLNGNRLFIGAKGDDQMGDGAGAVFVFHHTPIGWEFETKLVPPVVTPGAAFGTCIALDGNTAVVGAFAENDEIGAAYVFERRTGEWLPVAKLLASDGLPGDQFAAVSIDGALAVVGARGRDVVYVFSMTDYDSDGIGNNNDNCLTVANADQRDTDGDLYGNRCDPDFNEDGMINFVDLGVMKENFFSDDPDADLDGDGNVNFVDLGIMKAVFFGAPGPSGLVP